MALTTFPSEQAQSGKRVRVRILGHTMSAHGALHEGDELLVDHSEYLQLKAARKAELAKDRPKVRPAGDDDVAYLKVRGYEIESIAQAQKFLDSLGEQGLLGSYLAGLGKWVKDGRPAREQDQAEEEQGAAEQAGEPEAAAAAPVKQSRKK
jgi:hypothetical protein